MLGLGGPVSRTAPTRPVRHRRRLWPVLRASQAANTWRTRNPGGGLSSGDMPRLTAMGVTPGTTRQLAQRRADIRPGSSRSDDSNERRRGAGERASGSRGAAAAACASPPAAQRGRERQNPPAIDAPGPEITQARAAARSSTAAASAPAPRFALGPVDNSPTARQALTAGELPTVQRAGA
jgi:hypothetical protein